MSIVNAIANQALSRGAGELRKVMGNLPGSALSGSKPAFGISASMPQSINLQYPLNVEGDIQQGHYIMFFINATNPAMIKKDKQAAQDAEFRAGYLGETLQLNPKKKSIYQTAPKGALIIKRPATVRLEKAISLYMPPSVKATYTMQYAEAEIGAGAQFGASLIQDAIDSGKKGTVLADAMDLAKSAMGMGGPGGKKWASGGQKLGDYALTTAFSWAKGALQTVGPLVGLQGSLAAMQIASGKVMSNKMELLFTGVGRRKFSYTFTFIPKSEKESEMVANIVFTFKKHMTPSFGSIRSGIKGVNSTAGGRILNIPETFDIQYMYHSKENPWLNKISSCYLMSMDVQYGSNKAGFYEPLPNPALGGRVGPVPTHTTITLNFEEIEKMSRTRIEEGF